MTRCTPASHFLKCSGKSWKRRHHKDTPREGTKLRAAFDEFQANKGIPIEFRADVHNPRIMASLIDFYGLDIRHAGRKSQYILAGEWIGKVYIDYIAERLKAG